MKSQNWFEKPFSKQLIERAHGQLEPVLAEIFGYHAVQLGHFGANKFLATGPIRHRIIVYETQQPHITPSRLVQANFVDLPFLNDSIDLVLLPFVLSKTSKLELLLSEVWRVLIPYGQAVILSFNPYSIWRLWPGISSKDMPLIARKRLLSTLARVGFDVVTVKTFFHSLPANNVNHPKQVHLIDRIGAHCWPYLGACHMIVIRKTVSALTPIRPQWQSSELAKVDGIVKPCRRHSSREY